MAWTTVIIALAFSTVALAYLPAPTVLESPKDDAMIPSTSPVEFKWAPVPGAVRYRFGYGKRLIVGEERVMFPKDTQFTINVKQPGKYYWQLQAVDENNMNGEVSRGSFRIVVLPGKK